MLMLSMLGKNFSRYRFEIFFIFFFQKIGLDILCKLSPPRETVCMNCQILFSGKIIKISLLSTEFSYSMLSLKFLSVFFFHNK